MTEQPQAESTQAAPSSGDRRTFLAASTGLAMAGGLAAGYGTLGVMAGQFLYPAGPGNVAWQFVATVEQMAVGESLVFTGPSGIQVVVARQGEGSTEKDFIALSSVCPHLGCQVHWESQNDRFFCPCHNGAFDRQGRPTAGPPASANQHLNPFPLMVENGSVYIEVPIKAIGELAASDVDNQPVDSRSPSTRQA